LAQHALETIADCKDIERLRQYERLFDHALSCVDEVFQVCTEIPEPILPNFCTLGEDKFRAVKRLAVEYKRLRAENAQLEAKCRQQQREITELRNELKQATE